MAGACKNSAAPKSSLAPHVLRAMRRGCGMSVASRAPSARPAAAPRRHYAAASRSAPAKPSAASVPHLGHHAGCPCAAMSDKPFYNRLPLVRAATPRSAHRGAPERWADIDPSAPLRPSPTPRCSFLSHVPSLCAVT